MSLYDDEVVLELGGERLKLAQSYEVTCGIFTQPCAFALSTAMSALVPQFLKRYPPRTPFKLFISRHQVFHGYTDGEPDVDGDQQTAKVTFHGRDLLQVLVDSYVDADRTFENKPSIELVKLALETVGLKADVLVDNAKSRRTRSGVPIVSLSEPLVDPRSKNKKRVSRVGQTWYNFLETELKHSGLFLWAAADGGEGAPVFVASRPNPNQRPVAQLVHARGASNVLSFSRRNRTTKRFSEAKVFGRGGGKKFGRSKIHGSFEDDEMKAWGYKRLHTFKDVSVSSDAEADFFAARKIAETRREGFQLEYVVAGHTTPSLSLGRAVWCPDTMVEVVDNVMGFEGLFYVESCAYASFPTRTKLTLLRPEDLVFGSDEELDNAGGDGAAAPEEDGDPSGDPQP